MPVDVDSAEAVALKAKVDDQGNKVRELKTSGGDKADIDTAVQLLLQLKAEYKGLTGVDLGGGGGKKAKKEAKKAAAKGEPAPATKQAPAEKKAKVVKQENEVVKPETPQSAGQTLASGASVADRDMSMNAVLGRLAQRASQTDTIISQLKAQLTAVRQTAALSACKAEEERLKTQNEALKQEVQQLKERLVRAEIQNGVPQVALPKKDKQVPNAAPPKSAPAVAKQQAKPVNQDKQAASEAKPKKQEKKKENKPKAAGTANSGEGDSKVDISRIDMRIGKIVNVKNHPEADTLYLEEVDVGEDKNRTILSGLVKHVPQDQMQNRLAIFMCNLKPAKMRGIFSEGMIMCGSTPEKVEIIEPPAGVSVGDKVYVEGYEGTPDAQLNPKKKIFEQVQPDLRISPEGVATYKGVAWKVKGTEGLCTVPTMRDTPIK